MMSAICILRSKFQKAGTVGLVQRVMVATALLYDHLSQTGTGPQTLQVWDMLDLMPNLIATVFRVCSEQLNSIYNLLDQIGTGK